MKEETKIIAIQKLLKAGFTIDEIAADFEPNRNWLIKQVNKHVPLTELSPKDRKIIVEWRREKCSKR